MVQSRSKYEFYKESSLSQQLAHRYPEFGDYAGTEPDVSLTIALLNVLERHGKISFEKGSGVAFLKDVLNEQRKAYFATSDKVNEITKMGLQMPKREDEFTGADDEETDS